MGVRAWLSALLLAGSLLVAGCTGRACGNADSCSAVTPPGVGGLSSSSFAAIDSAGAAVDFNPRTGRAGNGLLPSTRDKERLVDIARDGPRSLIATYSTGPAVTSNVDGGAPKPGTCSGQVDRLDMTSGHVSELMAVGTNTLVTAVRPNPTGTEFAMVVSPCVPSYFNQHLAVQRIADDATWSIGAQLPRCHSLGVPAWTRGGRDLLVPYGAAEGKRPYAGSDGVCSKNHRNGLMQVASQTGQPGLVGTFSNAAAHCYYGSVASHADATYAITRCNRKARRATVSLVRLNRALHPTHTWPIGECEDGDSLAVNPRDHVLVSAYLFCNPPLHGHRIGSSVTVLERLTTTGLHRVAEVPGGQIAFRSLAW